MNFAWYDLVEGESLEQGDFFFSCPIIKPSLRLELERLEVEEEQYDVIVMSQSCDLEHGKINLVLVCPFWPLEKFRSGSTYYNSRRGLEELQRGNAPGYHLLNKVDIGGIHMSPIVVDFRNVYGVPFNFLQNIARSSLGRLRLLPPYKEHLSQAFARFFMRVGLPVAVDVD